MGVTIENFDYYKRSFEFRDGVISAKNSKNGPIHRCRANRIQNFKYVVLNQNVFNWISVDVDLSQPLRTSGINPLIDTQFFSDVELPFPNFVIYDSKGAHYLWHLATPFPFDASGKTFGKYGKIRDRIMAYMDGDFSCPKRNVAVKNPFWWGYSYNAYASFKKRVQRQEKAQGSLLDSSERSDVFTQRNSLTFSNKSYLFSDFYTFLDSVEEEKYHVRQTSKTDYYVGNRDCALFNIAGYEFSKKNKSMTREELVKFMFEFQKLYPEVPGLPLTQLNKIAISILRNTHYTWVAPRNYGAMKLADIDWSQLDAHERKEKIHERQQAGGRYTSALRKQQTIDKIRKAVQVIKKEKKKLSAVVIGKEAELSERTVRKYVRIKKNRLYWRVKEKKAA